MRYLLDTHTLIWWLLGDPSLSDAARVAIQSNDHFFFVSSISIFEIAIKVRGGRLDALAEPMAMIDGVLEQEGFEMLPLNLHHARRAGLMTGQHRDPFDRMLAAQGLIEGMTLITRDHEIAAFGCETLW